jgi:hypothetical protein
VHSCKRDFAYAEGGARRSRLRRFVITLGAAVNCVEELVLPGTVAGKEGLELAGEVAPRAFLVWRPKIS